MNEDKQYTLYKAFDELIREAIEDGLRKSRTSDEKKREGIIHQRIMDVLDPIIQYPKE